MTQLAKARVRDCDLRMPLGQRWSGTRPSTSDRIVVIPYGINPTFAPLEHARRPRRTSAGVDDESKVVLQVATKGRYKNTPACSKLSRSCEPAIADVTLVRIGSSAPPGRGGACAQAGHLRVHHASRHGRKTTDTLAEWYSAADVLCFRRSGKDLAGRRSSRWRAAHQSSRRIFRPSAKSSAMRASLFRPRIRRRWRMPSSVC